MSPEERTKVIELIQAVVSADGVVVEEEREFLRRVIERFHLSADDDRADHIVPSDPGRTTTMLRGLAPDVHARVMALLVDAAVADGRVAPEEHALLLAAAATIGIDAGALEERIALRLKTIARSPG